MTMRVECHNCENMILEITAKVNHGLCGVCHSVKIRESQDIGWEEAIVCDNCQSESCIRRVRGSEIEYFCPCCGHKA